ncbi:MAG: hypothetical protein VYC39_17545 [Myxococcota bacterium]|mgnify:FL=1|nr:hypothetical protein [Myxococcota bacterium]
MDPTEFDLVGRAMEEVMFSNPEMTFREICAELVKSGDLIYEVTHDPTVHAALYNLFSKCKARANFGRVNTDM